MSTTTSSTTATAGADVADDADDTADDPTGRARVYLAEVRYHLADQSSLPDDERDDLLDELAAHVREVAAADDRPLDEVLGTPRAFAVELLASAGLAPGERPRAGLPARAARAGRRLRGLATTAAEHPWARSVAAFLPELRPAWWVVRGCLVVYAVWILGAGDDLSTFPLPEIMGSRLVGTVALVAAAVASVRLARRTPARRWRWVADTAGVLAALVVVVNASTFRQTVFVDDGNPSYGLPLVPSGELTHPDGTPITNIRAYDAEGRPIDRVRLYDQDGRPIEPGAGAGVPWDESMPPGALGEGDTLTRRVVLDADGVPVGNLYPVEQAIVTAGPYGEVQRTVPVPPPTQRVPRLPLDPTSTDSTTTATTDPPGGTTPTTVLQPPPGS